MYRQAVDCLLGEVAETEEFFRAGVVAINITEAEPFTGDRSGHGDEIIGTKENIDENAYQWATVKLVGNTVRSCWMLGRYEQGRHGKKLSKTV